MERGKFQFAVVGVGHLAAAVRVRLREWGLSAEGGFQAACPSEPPLVLLACSDYPNPSSFEDLRCRAVGMGQRVVFACAAGTSVCVSACEGKLVQRVGPRRSWDFGLEGLGSVQMCDELWATPIRNIGLSCVEWVAQLGANVVVREVQRISERWG